MRYFDILIFISILSIGVYSADYEFSAYRKINEKNIYIKEKIDSYMFISESFKNTCNGFGFESLSEWQSECKNLWQLDYIAWTEADDFMIVKESEKGKLMFGTWVGPFGIGEIYCRSKNE